MTQNKFKTTLTGIFFFFLPTLGLINGPSYSGIVFTLSGLYILANLYFRAPIRMPDPWVFLALVAFVALGWASILWSFAPRHSLNMALQLTAVAAGTLSLLSAAPDMDDAFINRLNKIIAAAYIIGAYFLFMDWVSHFSFGHIIHIANSPTKYSRGIIYATIVAYPILAKLNNKYLFTTLFLSVLLICLIGQSSTEKTAFAISMAILLLSHINGKVSEAIIIATLLIISLLFPAIVHMMEPYRHDLVGMIKPSAVHRLEIWDYMTARIAERPIFGWGLGSSSLLPIRPEELQTYLWAKDSIYPHNQFIQIWVELGAAGISIFLAGSLYVVSSIRRLPIRFRPYAYADFMFVVMVSFADFEYTTDSLWAALAASALLFAAFARAEPKETV